MKYGIEQSESWKRILFLDRTWLDSVSAIVETRKDYACFCKEDDGTDLRIDIPEPINSGITFKRPGSFLLIGVIHAPHRAPDNLFKGDNVRDTAYTAG